MFGYSLVLGDCGSQLCVESVGFTEIEGPYNP